ncbi:MAG: hypothetical protein AAB352_02860 [Patescibacteria group bacterium]
MAIKPTISVKDFIEQISKMEAEREHHWVEKAATTYPQGLWEGYKKQAMTEAGIKWLVTAVPTQICSTLRHLFAEGKNYKSAFLQGEAFLQAIKQKAQECGIDVSEIHSGPIFKPG